MRKISVLALIGVCATAGGVASAVETPEPVETRTETVTYDATSAATDAKSAKKLFFRIRGAAAEVCQVGSHPVGHELWETHACEAGAVAEAVRAADVPALDAYYTDVTGRTLN